jgi:lipoate-protein ligase A
MGDWRLIPLMETSGTLNMAIDEWLLDQHRVSAMPSVLRFYLWNPPAISLGYHQTQWPQHWRNLTWQGRQVDLVRRPTGGRAVLHVGDLTYAIVTSGMRGRRMQVYQALCQFLIEGWRSLGTSLHYGDRNRDYRQHHNCFATPTAADLVTDSGNKLIGSAQLRRHHAILQHGSMQLKTDRLLYHQIFTPEATVSRSSLTSPKASLCQHVPTIVDALTAAAQSCFEMTLRVQPLSSEEWAAIEAYQQKTQVSAHVSAAQSSDGNLGQSI